MEPQVSVSKRDDPLPLLVVDVGVLGLHVSSIIFVSINCVRPSFASQEAEGCQTAVSYWNRVVPSAGGFCRGATAVVFFGLGRYGHCGVSTWVVWMWPNSR